jgi:hypothetical protein
MVVEVAAPAAGVRRVEIWLDRGKIPSEMEDMPEREAASRLPEEELMKKGAVRH